MIRPLTLVSAALFVLSGAYLFAVKQRAQVLDDQLAQAAQATRLDEQRVQVLQAQWALEVDPSRLQQLAAQFTTLQPMQPSQMVALSQLPEMLPAPNSPVPGSNPAGSAPPAENDAGAVVAQAAPPVVSPAGAPVHLASAELVQPPADAVRSVNRVPVHAAARRVPVTAGVRFASLDVVSHERPVHVAPHREVPVRHISVSHLYAARSTYVPPPVPVRPMGARVLAVRAVAVPTPPLPPTMAESGGSMLGMAQSTGSGN